MSDWQRGDNQFLLHMMSSQRWWVSTSHCLLYTQVPNCWVCSPSSSNISGKLWTLASCAWWGRLMLLYYALFSGLWAVIQLSGPEDKQEEKKHRCTNLLLLLFIFSVMYYAMFRTVLQDVVQYIQYQKFDRNKKSHESVFTWGLDSWKSQVCTVFINSF